MATPPRILITTPTFPPDANGVAHVSGTHAYGLAQRGYDVTVATAHSPARSDAQRQGNPAVVEFRTRGNGNLRVGYRGQVQEYRDFAAGFDGDVIMCHCWQIWTTDLAYQAFAASTAKKVLISHGVSANSTYGFPPRDPNLVDLASLRMANAPDDARLRPYSVPDGLGEPGLLQRS